MAGNLTQQFDPTVYLSLAFLFGITAQFRAMDGSSVVRGVLPAIRRRTGILYAVVLVTLLSSPFILNDVVILILTPVVVAYAKEHGVNPVPLVVAEITFANIASSLTPFGNPQNILLWSASGASVAGFILGTWPAVAASAVLGALALLPFALRVHGPESRNQRSGSSLPLLYLMLVAAVILLSDSFGTKPYVPLGVAFMFGFAVNFRSPAKVLREFDLRSLAVLYLFVASVTVAAYYAAPYIVGYVGPVASGSQPYSGLFLAGTSNVISNVRATQMVLSVASVTPHVASKIAVEAGLAGNLDPIASFANILALQVSGRNGVSLRKVILLQLAVGAVSFVPALF